MSEPSMIETQGRVVAVEPGGVWVEAERRSACSECNDSKGCGMAAVSELFGTRRVRLRLPAVADVQPGDVVVIGLPEGRLPGLAVIVYLVPLLCLFAAALLAARLGAGQGLQVLAALAGLLAGLWLAGRLASLRPNAARDRPVIVGGARRHTEYFHSPNTIQRSSS